MFDLEQANGLYVRVLKLEVSAHVNVDVAWEGIYNVSSPSHR